MLRALGTCIVIVCLAILATGCGTSYQLAKTVRDIRSLTEDRVFPSEPKFTVQPQEVAEGVGIEFEAVYYLEHRSMPGVSSDTGRYLRFWPDGRVMQRVVARKPGSEEADEFLGGWLGYYQLKEGKLVMEFFAPTAEKYRWGYYKMEAAIQGEQILVVQGERNRRSEVLNRVYDKHPLKGMKRLPDW